MPDPEVEVPIKLEEGESESFKEWRFRANEIEDIKLKLDARESELATREKSFELLQAQIENERSELINMRKQMEDLRASIEQDYIIIKAEELSNLQRLASIYSEVKAEATVNVFEGLEDAEVVKILSLMPTESSARVLGQMGSSDDSGILKRASKLTSDLRKVKE